MIIFFKYILAAIIFISIQAVFFKGIKPDLVLILVFFYSLKCGSIKGMAYGAVTGVMVDSASGVIFGPNILSKMFIGYIMASIRQRLYQWNLLSSIIMVTICSSFDILMIHICYEIFPGISFMSRPMNIPLLQVIYTAGFSLLAYPFLNSKGGTRSLI